VITSGFGRRFGDSHADPYVYHFASARQIGRKISGAHKTAHGLRRRNQPCSGDNAAE